MESAKIYKLEKMLAAYPNASIFPFSVNECKMNCVPEIKTYHKYTC